MKFITFFSTILATVVPIHAANSQASVPTEFTFNMPAAYSGFPNPGGSVTVNLTGLSPRTFALIGSIKTGDPEQFQALEIAIKQQIPDYLATVQDIMKLGNQDCDLSCCEELCFLIAWLPFFTAACSKSISSRQPGPLLRGRIVLTILSFSFKSNFASSVMVSPRAMGAMGGTQWVG